MNAALARRKPGVQIPAGPPRTLLEKKLSRKYVSLEVEIVTGTVVEQIRPRVKYDLLDYRSCLNSQFLVEESSHSHSSSSNRLALNLLYKAHNIPKILSKQPIVSLSFPPRNSLGNIVPPRNVS